MKKLLVLVAVLFTALMFGQKIGKGEVQINGGLGFTSGWGIPVYAGFDYGIHPDITVGGQVSYASENHSLVRDVVKGTWFGLGANANYHFNTLLEIPNEWDVYAGFTLAYNNFSWDYPSSYPNDYRTGVQSHIGFGAQVGVRYFFTNNLGVNLEFGGGNVAAGGKIGITYKL